MADKLAGMARAAPETLVEAGFTESDRCPLNPAALALRRGHASYSDYRLLLEVAGFGASEITLLRIFPLP